MMSVEEVDKRLTEARFPDGSYDGNVIAEMNKAGVRFAFLKEGVRWKMSDWTEEELERFESSLNK